jgi:diguanylate cyclase (GGDEF)-like protein/hemerythrin-like metal-binding protein
MNGPMANLLLPQLDYIYFLYGLVLVLLGSVCFSMAGTSTLGTPWWILGLFGFAHGVAEWLQLPVMMALAPGGLKVFSGLLGAASYALLLEFARRTHGLIARRKVSPWIHAAVGLALLWVSLSYGWSGFRSAYRLLVAWPAATWTCGLFLVAAARTEALDGNAASRRARRWAALFFGAYSLACGALVPAAPFLPGFWFTAEAFVALTGVPVQLLRTLVLAGITLSIWALSVSFAKKGRIQAKRTLIFRVVVASIVALLGGGWALTDWLGRLHDQDVQVAARSSAAQVHDHLKDRMENADGAAKAAAGVLEIFYSGAGQSTPLRLDQIVDSVASASPDFVAYVLDSKGTAVAASNRNTPGSFLGVNYAIRPYWQDAMAGRPGHFIGMGIMTKVAGYFGSHPVRGPDGKVVAVAAVKVNLVPKYLGPMVEDDSFIISPDGRVLVSSVAGLQNRMLWNRGPPSTPATAAGSPPALLDHPVEGTGWVTYGGKRHAAVHLTIPYTDWSLVVLKRDSLQLANRFLGIVITLLLCIVVLVFFVAMQQQVASEVTVDDRRRLAEGRAREFARQADTDALTGLLNRLGFNGAFGREFERARRYKLPLSVVILDLDHFKRVNDVHGHSAGDQVLVGVARILEGQVRQSDFVARWGGEEFVVLAPMTDAGGAVKLAEKLRGLMETTPLGPAGVVTGSFGVAQLRSGDSIEGLLQRADAALYRVKESTRNAVGCADLAAAEEPAPPPAHIERPQGAIYPDTGYGPIDRDHRVLAEALEVLVRKVNAGLAVEAQLALQSIMEAAAHHFENEQRLMEEFDYPLQARHLEAHALFVDDACQYLLEIRELGMTASFRQWVERRLLDWFRLHVQGHDMALATFLCSENDLEPPAHARAG